MMLSPKMPRIKIGTPNQAQTVIQGKTKEGKGTTVFSYLMKIIESREKQA